MKEEAASPFGGGILIYLIYLHLFIEFLLRVAACVCLLTQTQAVLFQAT